MDLDREKERELDEKDKIMVDIKSFDIDLNKEKYTIELAKSENEKNIIIKIYNENQKKLKYYISYRNKESFYDLDNFFKLYQSVNDLYNLLLDIINNKQYSLDVKHNHLILNLNFFFPGGKKINIDFKLNEEKVKKGELVDELYGTVNQF